MPSDTFYENVYVFSSETLALVFALYVMFQCWGFNLAYVASYFYGVTVSLCIVR